MKIKTQSTDKKQVKHKSLIKEVMIGDQYTLNVMQTVTQVTDVKVKVLH